MAARVSDRQILDAVAATVLAHGYAGATTRQIAATAQINEVTLFRRFGDKDTLIRAAIAQEVEAFTKAGPAYTGDLEADLHRVLDFYARVLRERGRMVIMLLAEAPRHPQLADAVRQPVGVIRQLVAMIRRYQADGLLVEEPAADTVTDLLGPLLMQVVGAHIDPSFANHTSVERHLARFLDGHRR